MTNESDEAIGADKAYVAKEANVINEIIAADSVIGG
jgi:hypothetical protein